jgi:hypothetical protein
VQRAGGTSGIVRDSGCRTVPLVSTPFRERLKSSLEKVPKTGHFRGAGA